MSHEKIDLLPNYIEDEFERRYFLTINKTLDGSWSAEYTGFLHVGEVELDEGTIPEAQVDIGFGGFVNNCVDLNEVYTRMEAKLRRRQKIIK